MVWSDEKLLKRALSHLKRVAKGHKFDIWYKLLTDPSGEPELRKHLVALFEHANFEDMPWEEKNWWNTYMQDHPFSSIFAVMVYRIQRDQKVPWKQAVEMVLKMDSHDLEGALNRIMETTDAQN